MLRRVKTWFAAVIFFVVACRVMAGGQKVVVDQHQSRIEVQVKATLDSFIARLTVFDPVIVYDPVLGRVLNASLGFRFEDLKTGKDERDRQMNEWQQTAEFPTARFELANIESLAASQLRARGALTLHGVNRELEFPVVITGDRNRLSIDGEATLDTRDFGLKVIRKFALLRVSPEVIVRFHLQGHLEDASPAGKGGAS